MKASLYILSFLLLLFSCTKLGENIFVSGRVINPVTNKGIPNIEVELLKISKTISLSSGFKGVKSVYTDENARLDLQAGESIDALPGTTFLNGCQATLIIYYASCPAGKNLQNSPSNNNSSEINNLTKETDKTIQEEFIKKSEIRVFPNPSEGSFTIANMQDIPFDHFEIYDLSGNLVVNVSNIGKARYECKNCLTKGFYILHLYSDGVLKQQKISIP